MGHIRESKLDNGMAGLEITYGGKDAPFGGVDSSAPPMYIDRNCFADAAGFLVLNEQLIAAGWFDSGVQLQSWIAELYLGSGSWYVNGKYKNFVLAYRQTPLVNPVGTRLDYKIWVWDSGTTGNIPLTATLSLIQGAEFSDPTPATAQIAVSNSYTVTVPVTISITSNAATASVTYNPTGGAVPQSPKELAAALVALINGFGPYPCTAALNSDGLTITLTTKITGVAANGTTLSVDYAPNTQPQNGVNALSPFTGGTDSYVIPTGQPGVPLSWTVVAETLYFAGFGCTAMLSYTEVNGVPIFQILTQYLGANTLSKYNGQLIAAGITLGPGLRLSCPEMIIAWSASNALGVWNPINADGTVTGAGFNQETDISDYLTGILIGSGMGIILRTQGVDYITPVSSGVTPFDFAHISNALQGEGAQDARLVTQYDQLGVFVGNSDIYEFAGGLNPIGAKIRNRMIPAMGPVLLNRSATSLAFGQQYQNLNVLIFFLIDQQIFVYSGTSKTWMVLTFDYLAAQQNLVNLTNWRTFTSIAGQLEFNDASVPILAVQDLATHAPTFYILNQGVQNVDFTHAVPSFVLFPQEEVMFGRDITIDALLVSAAGSVGQVMTFTVTGQNSEQQGGANAPSIVGTLTLPAIASDGKFHNYQVFFNTSNTDKGTMQNPQLRLDVPLSLTTIAHSLRIAKIAMFVSFDPNQRPV